MKILHTADWHLGQRFHNNTRFAEHKYFLTWLLQQLHEQQPDVLVIAGDIYDSPTPAAEAEGLLYDFLDRATDCVEGLQVLITSGNHDSGTRLETTAPLMARQRIFLRGIVHKTETTETQTATPDFNHLLLPLRNRESEQIEALALLVPFLRPNDVGGHELSATRQFFESLHQAADASRWAQLPRIMVAHLYATGTELNPSDDADRYIVGGQEQVPAEAMGRTAYTALGHIHKAMPVKNSKAWYAGSPIPLSFNELGYTHGVNLVELDTEGKAHIQRLVHTPLRQLMRLPASGEVSIKKLFDLVQNLPSTTDNTDTSRWPYLEVCFAANDPDLDKLNDLHTLLSTRAVVFCKFTRKEHTLQHDITPTTMHNIEHMMSITPMRMLEMIYEKNKGQALPEELSTRFAEVEQAVTQQQAIQNNQTNR